MKKTTTILSLFIIAMTMILGAAGFYKREQAVNKEINLSISSSNNYSPAAYRNDKASVHVVVTKMCGAKQTVVMDKVYDSMHLQDIPTNGNAINKRIVIPNVLNKREKLIVTYTISYESSGSILQYSNGKIASDKNNQEQIEINI